MRCERCPPGDDEGIPTSRRRARIATIAISRTSIIGNVVATNASRSCTTLVSQRSHSRQARFLSSRSTFRTLPRTSRIADARLVVVLNIRKATSNLGEGRGRVRGHAPKAAARRGAPGECGGWYLTCIDRGTQQRRVGRSAVPRQAPEPLAAHEGKGSGASKAKPIRFALS